MRHSFQHCPIRSSEPRSRQKIKLGLPQADLFEIVKRAEEMGICYARQQRPGEPALPPNVTQATWDSVFYRRSLELETVSEAAIAESDPRAVHNWVLLGDGAAPEDSELEAAALARSHLVRLIIDQRLRLSTFDLSRFLATFDGDGDERRLAAFCIVTSSSFGFCRLLTEPLLRRQAEPRSAPVLSAAAQARFDALFRDWPGKCADMTTPFYRVGWLWARCGRLDSAHSRVLLEHVVSVADAHGAAIVVDLVGPDPSAAPMLTRAGFRLRLDRPIDDGPSCQSYYRPSLNAE